MRGKIALEEAFEMAGMEDKSKREAELWIHPDHHDRYIRRRPRHRLHHRVPDLPGIQGISDQSAAEKRATEVNDWVARQIESRRDRLGAFACLSMHDPVQAGQELRRCVTELGFHGALLNDFQHAGPGGETYLFYDQPAYDTFWKVVTELDVPVYIHPAAPADVVYDKFLHLLGMVSNGVFDRFPDLKIIVGHYGEHIPFDFWRINHWFEDVKRPLAKSRGDVMCEKTIYDYFKRNILVTTSGHFSTHTLKNVVDEFGADRVLFSVDYPYEAIESASAWVDGRAQEVQEAVGGKDAYRRIGRDNAKTLMRLSDFRDEDAPVDRWYVVSNAGGLLYNLDYTIIAGLGSGSITGTIVD